jgi:hypothetical protein
MRPATVAIVRCRLLLALPVLAVAVGFGVPAASGASTDCRTPDVRTSDEVVFGHFATESAASAFGKHAHHFGFEGIKIENHGCGDFSVAIGGADRSADRGSFATEAATVGYAITFQQMAPPLRETPRSTYGVLGTFNSISKANALSWKLAKLNFRYIEITYLNGKWLVVMPAVPFKAALSIAQEVAKAGYHIAFRPG